jgi:hypothetical protein
MESEKEMSISITNGTVVSILLKPGRIWLDLGGWFVDIPISPSFDEVCLTQTSIAGTLTLETDPRVEEGE